MHRRSFLASIGLLAVGGRLPKQFAPQDIYIDSGINYVFVSRRRWRQDWLYCKGYPVCQVERVIGEDLGTRMALKGDTVSSFEIDWWGFTEH